MGQDIVVPESFKSGPVQAFNFLNPDEENLSEGIGHGYGVIGYKGKVWSLRVRGEKYNFVRVDDGTPLSYIDVIVLSSAKQKSKSFYKKYDPNGSSEGDRPICSSIDGIKPDPDGDMFGKTGCQLCPRNEWKVNPQNGKKGRECTDYKRLAVLVLPTLTTPLLGAPLMEPVFLRVPPASLNSLATMGDTMAKQGWHHSAYVTRITFDPEQSWPEMIFRPLQGLTEKEAPVIKSLREDAICGRIINGDVVLSNKGGPALLQTPGATETGLVLEGTATDKSTSTVAAPSQPATSLRSAAAPAATPASTTPPTNSTAVEPPSNTTTVDTGFGGAAIPAAKPQQTASPAPQTTADTGEAEASDADLDAQVAGLIQTS